MINFLVLIRNKLDYSFEVRQVILDKPDLGLHMASDNIGQHSLKQWNTHADIYISINMQVCMYAFIYTDARIYILCFSDPI